MAEIGASVAMGFEVRWRRRVGAGERLISTHQRRLSASPQAATPPRLLVPTLIASSAAAR